MDISSLLIALVEKNGSDLFLSAFSPPYIKADGKMMPLDQPPLDAETNQRIIYSILTDKESAIFEKELELNKSLHLENIGRFRVNVFRQQGQPALVIRYIKDKIPSIDKLGLPEVVKELIMEKRGLILVVGGTGTGKSTSLAAMIDYRNKRSTGHILTIEDPIEFVYESKKSLVNQREVGLDTLSFDSALINAMREAPDVILIGEIRDAKTMQQAMTYAETGHLCLATLHANNANQAIERIINFFPTESHSRVLQDLSLNLKAVISQRLCAGIDSKYVAAIEVMIATPFIADLIEKGDIDAIKEAMERSNGRACKTFDQALFEMIAEGRIGEEEALDNADSRSNLTLRLRLEGNQSERGYPVTSEFSIDKKAPFDHYTSFKVSPINVKGHQANAQELLDNAITYALTRKGLNKNEATPDLDIQYVLGLKNMDGLSVIPIAGEGENFKNYVPPTEEHGMLVVNVVSTRTQKPVYRLTASRKTSDNAASQESMDQLLYKLLQSLPVSD